jgi:hypothetical protein
VNLWLMLRYSRRNLARVIPVGIIMALTVFAAVVITAVIDSLAYNALSSFSYLQAFSRVSPTQSLTIPGELAEEIEGHPAVADSRQLRVMSTPLQLLVGTSSFDVLVVDAETLAMLADLYHLELREGRWPTPGTNEMVFSQAVVNAKGLQLGDLFGQSVDDQEWIVGEFELVGVVEGDVRIGLASLEYLSEQELYARYPEGLLVVPKDQQMGELDAFLEELADGSGEVKVTTYESIKALSRQEMSNLYMVLALVDILAIAIVSLAVGVLNYIYFLHRTPEFAIRQVLGFSFRSLLVGSLAEIGSLLGSAWLAGVLLALAALAQLGQAVFEPRGLLLEVGNLKPVLLSLPIPAAVTLFGVLALWRPLWNLDPVSVIDRRL